MEPEKNSPSVSVDELVRMLDRGMAKGVGHVNVNTSTQEASPMSVQTMGCTDCSNNPMACSVPTLHEGLDDNE